MGIFYCHMGTQISRILKLKNNIICENLCTINYTKEDERWVTQP